MSLNTLADHLSARYKKLGAMEDLDEAIVLDQEALNLFLQGHHDQSTSLSNIADHLSIGNIIPIAQEHEGMSV